MPKLSASGIDLSSAYASTSFAGVMRPAPATAFAGSRHTPRLLFRRALAPAEALRESAWLGLAERPFDQQPLFLT